MRLTLSKRSWVLTVALLTTGILIFAILHSRREPTYKGHPFSYWLHRTPVTIVPTNGHPGLVATTNEIDFSNSLSAINAVGKDCLPTILKQFRARDVPWGRKLTTLGVKCHLLDSSRLHSATIKRGQAVTALQQLGPNADAIVPELMSLTQDKDTEVRASAWYVLSRVAPHLGQKHPPPAKRKAPAPSNL